MNNLLQRPLPQLMRDVSRAIDAAAGAFAVPRGHIADLPYAVRDLSRLLTAERGDLSRSYWSAPRYLAAYMRYFLPWNLFRLAWLLPGLELLPSPAEEGKEEARRVLDLGCGPLTLPLALWCSRPDMRSLPLQITCTDVAVKPMEIGLAAYRKLAGTDSPWRIRLSRGHLEGVLGKSRERFDLIMAGNLLNELSPGKGESLEERLEGLVAAMSGKLLPGGRLLLIEPGTRLGGKMIALSRKTALEQGLRALSPCTHQGPCPAIEQAAYHPDSPGYSGWCHFVSPARDVPPELAALSKKARLEKESLAVSCLLLEKPERAKVGDCAGNPDSAFAGIDSDDFDGKDELAALDLLYRELMEEDSGIAASRRGGRERPGSGGRKPGREECRPGSEERKPGRAGRNAVSAISAGSADREGGGEAAGEAYARVISHPINMPGEEAPSRYVCCSRGLGIIPDALTVPSGAAVRIRYPARPRRDRKSGALLLDRR